MSNSIRDLVVSIDFSDIDVRELLRVDSAINEIEDELRQMGHQIDDVGDEFTQMGIDALLASAVADEALQSVESQARDTQDEIHDIGDSFGIAGIKALAMAKVWILGSSAAIAASAPLLELVGGLAASFAAAGIAAGAFGVVAGSAIAEVIGKSKEVEKLEKKIANAKSTKERIGAQKELAKLYSTMSKYQIDTIKHLEKFKEFWNGFVNMFEPTTFAVFNYGLDALKKILIGLAPAIGSTAKIFEKLMKQLNEKLDSGGFQEFFNWLTTNGAGAIYNFATIGGNLMGGFFNILKAFSPIGAGIEQTLVTLSDKFLTWSQTFETSQGFQDFVAYAEQNGPVLLQTISNLWDIFKKLIADLAPLGTEVLLAIQNVTSAINDNWPEVITTVLSLAAGIGTFLTLMKGMQIIGVVTNLIKALRTGTLLLTLAEYGLNTALLANPITWVIAAIAALVAIGVVLYRNWDTVKEKAKQVWAVIKDNPLAWIVAGPIMALITAGVKLYQNWDKVSAGFSRVWSNIESGAARMVASVIGQINKMISFVNKLPGINIPKIAIASKVPYKTTTKSGGGTDGVGTVNGAYMATHSHATGLERVPYDGYIGKLHRGEAILTAAQSNALRAAGILGRNGDKPKLNLDEQVAPSGKMKSGSTVFSPSVKIEVNGTSGDAKEIAKQAALAARKELEKLFADLGMAY